MNVQCEWSVDAHNFIKSYQNNESHKKKWNEKKNKVTAISDSAWQITICCMMWGGIVTLSSHIDLKFKLSVVRINDTTTAGNVCASFKNTLTHT